jgi:hypothetical protein
MKRTAVAIAIALTGCAGSEGPTLTGSVDEPPPANYRELAREHMRTIMFDPYSARDPFIAKPKNGGSVLYPGWVICVRVNAKNSLGAYTGPQITAVTVRAGKVTVAQTDTGWMFCDGVEYEPFPELVG